MKKINSIEKNKYIIILTIFIISTISITICSKNSPLYSFNDWVDAHAFFTMGKGIFNGKIPYKDLFEQKGPLLYLIYGIGYLINHQSFIGIYIIEIIFFTVFLYYCFKIANYYVKNTYSLCIVMITASLITSSTAFVQGGSAEELCLPFIAISTYHFIKIISEKNFEKKYLFINGFFAGCIALIKFNLLGFWFIWMALYFFKLISIKKIKLAFISCIYFLIGMFVPIVMSIIYFVFNNAIKDYFEVYITFNLTAYSTTIGIKNRIMNMLIAIYSQMTASNIIFILLIICLISTLIKHIFKDLWINVFILLSFIFLMIGVYIGGLPFIYYFLCFEFYIVFGLIFIFYLIENFINKNKWTQIIVPVISFILMICFVGSTQNLQYKNLPKNSYAQFTFKEIIEKSPNQTLLNYDNLDGGFYTTCGIVPNIKYFMRQNVAYDRYPQIIDGQNEVIKNKEVEFVVIREYFGNMGYRDSIPYLNENYHIVDSKQQIYEGMDFNYYLYQLK